MRRVYERFRARGLQVVYVGPFETDETCAAWKQEYDLPFPVVPDADGTLFKRLAAGWVPWSLLVSVDHRVVFSENEFDEQGFSAAITRLLAGGTATAPAASATRAATTPHPRRPGPTTTVVLGGGVGGLVTARRLRARIGRQHRIVVIDSSPHHLLQASLLWVLEGSRSVEQIQRPLDRLRRHGIEFINEPVVGIDLQERTVATSTLSSPFDYLVVALGARTAPESVDGFAAMAHDLYRAEGCLQAHDALERFEGGRVGIVVTSMPFKCPAAPYEAAFLLESYLRRKGVRSRSEILLHTPEHQPMPVAGPVVGRAIVEMLEARGIHYHPLFTFERMRPEAKEIVAADGAAEALDLVIAVPPHHPPEVVRAAGLTGVSGWIHVDPETLRTEHDGVFAVGDVASVRLPGGKSLPKAGVFAHHQAEVVARQIGAELRGEDSQARFDGQGACWIELGDGRAGFASGDFFAEPEPAMRMARPGRLRHWTKVAFEKWWLWRWL